MQKDGQNTLFDKIKSCFAKKPKKAYFFFCNFKENGFKVLEEEMIDTTTKYYIVIGVDKKNTTRIMLDSILDYTKDVYYYSNNGLNEYTSNICIFEYTNEVYMYVGSSNVSESGLMEDISIYTEIVYDLSNKDEKASYKAEVKELVKKVETEGFNKLTKAEIDRLVEEKEIFTTRQYNHNVKSISELLGSSAKEQKKEASKEEIDEVYVQDKEIPKVDLSDLSLDIDLSDLEAQEEKKIENLKNNEKSDDDIQVSYNEEEYNNISNNKEVKEFIENNKVEKEDDEIKLDVNNELYDASMANDVIDTSETIDISDILFSKSDVKLDLDNIKKEKKQAKKKVNEDEMVQVKKVNLNNISNFIFELPSRPLKEQDQNVIKIPNYIRMMIPEFFGFNEKLKNVEISGVMYKVRDIKLEVVDVGTGVKYTDRNAKITYKTGQSYITISSDTFKNIIYNEEDIARMIKLSGDIYHIEIIPKSMQEYKLWSKICNQTFKSTTRKYGMM